MNTKPNALTYAPVKPDVRRMMVVDVLVRQCFSFELVASGAFEDSRIAAPATWRVGAFEGFGDHCGRDRRRADQGENPPAR
ncbi:hypothetical protein [Nocardia africana]